jgi:hypothetical protein
MEISIAVRSLAVSEAKIVGLLAHARWDLMRSLRNRYHLAAQRGLVELMDAGHHTALAACSSKFPNKLPKNSENPYQEPTNETN